MSGKNTAAHPAAGSRRTRNMQEKQQRIFTAARDLFEERGFAAVSTHAVSERADVAAGTLFRYAATKGELLLMVYNEEMKDTLRAARRAAARHDSADDAIAAAILPLLDRADVTPENSLVYQRELLFGTPGEKYRDEGLALVTELETWIARRLDAAAQSRGLSPDTSRADVAAAAIFASAALAISRTSTGAHPARDPRADLTAQIRLLADGYLTGLLPAADTPPTTSSVPQGKKQ